MLKQLKTISGNAAMTLMAISIAYPAAAQPIPSNARNACTQSTAEFMTVAARNLSIMGAGEVDPENGVRTLFMRNNQTGQTADCRVNTIDGTVLSVTMTGGNSNSSKPVNAQAACIQQTAEAMVVAARNITVTNAGPIAGNGVRTLFMQNTKTGQTANCRVNTIDGTVLSVKLDGGASTPVRAGLAEVVGAGRNGINVIASPYTPNLFRASGVRNGTVVRVQFCGSGGWCRVQMQDFANTNGWLMQTNLRQLR